MTVAHLQPCVYRLIRAGIGGYQFGLWTEDRRCLLESAMLLTAAGALQAIERTRRATGQNDRYWWRLSRDRMQRLVLLDENGQFLCASPRHHRRSHLEADVPLMQRWGPTAEVCIVPPWFTDGADARDTPCGMPVSERRQQEFI